MKFLRLCGAIGCAVIFTLALRSQTSDSSSLPLPEDYFPVLKSTIESALKQSPKMVAQNVELYNAEQDRIVARAGLLPSLSGSLGYYPYDRQTRADLVGSTQVKKVAYNLSLAQPLFHWGALRNNLRIAMIQVKIAEGDVAEAYRLLANEIRGQYLELILKKISLIRTRYNAKLAEERLALGKTKLEKHIIAESDLFGPTIDAEQSLLWKDRVEAEFLSSCRMFAKLTGTPVLSESEIPDAIPPIAGEMDQVQTRLKRFTGQEEPNTLAMHKMRMQMEIENLNYATTKVRMRPKVTAIAGITQDQQNYSLMTNYKYQVQDEMVGIQVSWAIFDGFANGAYKAKVLTRKRELDRAYQAQKEELMATVRTQVKLVEFAGRGLAIEEKLLGSAVNAVKVRRDEVARGTATEADVSGAELALYDEQLRAFSARRDYIMGISTFLSTINEDPILSNVISHRK